MGCEVIERPILKGMEIAIKQGDKLYVWPDFVMPKELKYIEVQTTEEWMAEETKKRLAFWKTEEKNLISRMIEYRFYRNNLIFW